VLLAALRESAPGPERHFAAVQQDACNGGQTGQSAGDARTVPTGGRPLRYKYAVLQNIYFPTFRKWLC
jgi:hypothetical protein